MRFARYYIILQLLRVNFSRFLLCNVASNVGYTVKCRKGDGERAAIAMRVGRMAALLVD